MKYPEIDQYYADPSPENRDKLMDILGQEHFKISDLGVTSRVFSNWKIKNIIPKVDERQWVRLNLFEYFWIQIIFQPSYMFHSIRSVSLVSLFTYILTNFVILFFYRIAFMTTISIIIF